MFMKQDLKTLGANIVYLKPVATADLPDNLRAEAGEIETIFAVHNASGEQVALVADAEVAAALAQRNALQLVQVH